MTIIKVCGGDDYDKHGTIISIGRVCCMQISTGRILFSDVWLHWGYICREIVFKTFAGMFNIAGLNLNFHPLEVVSRYRDTQLQVGENYLSWVSYTLISSRHVGAKATERTLICFFFLRMCVSCHFRHIIFPNARFGEVMYPSRRGGPV